ncbi:MAG: pyridoxal-phosphate dependent enzyme [Desulfurococcaceae archaeon]
MSSFDEFVDEIYRRSIEALSILENCVVKTPLLNNIFLDNIFGYKTYLKLENLQLTGAFKIRGAVYKIHKLKNTIGLNGVVAATSGNHGLGVAYASRLYGVKAIIVMPKTASLFKINSIRKLGAEVLIHGDYLDNAYEKAFEIASRMNYEFIHSYEDIDTISGQATIAHEILEIVDPKYVLVPVGGGGLISGLSIVFKKRKPGVKIIGIEPKNCPKTYDYIKKKSGETIIKPSIADAVLVKKPGEIASKIIEKYVDDIVLVEEKDIVDAIYFSLNNLKTIVEGAGALPLASLLSNSVSIHSEPVVGVITGGNIDPLILRDIIVQKELNNRLFIIKGFVKDDTSVFNKLISVLNEYGCRLIDINIDRFKTRKELDRVYVELIVETINPSIIRDIVDKIKNNGLFLEIES